MWDIGDKMGYNAVDNGFFYADPRLQYPKDAMLMGHSKVFRRRDVRPSTSQESGVWNHGICSIRYRHERGFIHEESCDDCVTI